MEQNIDTDKIDNAALALLYLSMHDRGHGDIRAWKNLAWEITDRLHEKGYIYDPKNKAKSVSMTPKGQEKSAKLYALLFGKDEL